MVFTDYNHDETSGQHFTVIRFTVHDYIYQLLLFFLKKEYKNFVIWLYSINCISLKERMLIYYRMISPTTHFYFILFYFTWTKIVHKFVLVQVLIVQSCYQHALNVVVISTFMQVGAHVVHTLTLTKSHLLNNCCVNFETGSPAGLGQFFLVNGNERVRLFASDLNTSKGSYELQFCHLSCEVSADRCT